MTPCRVIAIHNWILFLNFSVSLFCTFLNQLMQTVTYVVLQFFDALRSFSTARFLEEAPHEKVKWIDVRTTRWQSLQPHYSIIILMSVLACGCRLFCWNHKISSLKHYFLPIGAHNFINEKNNNFDVIDRLTVSESLFSDPKPYVPVRPYAWKTVHAV